MGSDAEKRLFNAWTVVLREARKEQGLTRERAALKGKVSVSTWYRWERGEAIPRPGHLSVMAAGVGLEPRDLARRYSRQLYLHYCDDAPPDETSSADEKAAAAPRDRAAPAREDEGAAAPGPGLTGLAPGYGPVWIELSELVELLSQRKDVRETLIRSTRPTLRPVPRPGRGHRDDGD